MKIDTKAIRERCEKATPGEWFFEQSGCDSQITVLVSGHDDYEDPEFPDRHAAVLLHGGMLGDKEIESNWDFIAHSRTDLPACLDRIDELERVLRKVLSAEHSSNPKHYREAIDAVHAILEGE